MPLQIGYLIMMYTVGLLGTGLFYILHIPLPWILGPLIAIFTLNSFIKPSLHQSKSLLQWSFLITGAQIGTNFTEDTLAQVLPYFIPFLLMTVILVFICIKSGEWMAQYAEIDRTTGILGSVPGGLSVMLEISDSVKANTGMVAIFHTIRLMSVLMLVPMLVMFLFTPEQSGGISSEEVIPLNGWTIALFIALFGLAYLVRFKMPAPFVLIPMFIIAILRIISIPVSDVPIEIYHVAQLSIGIHLGLSISFSDFKTIGRYSFLFFLFSTALIAISALFGYLLSLWSSLTFATAMLSLAPGGLVEMAITAHEVNADPAIVGSLQLIRMLFISLILPFVLKKVFTQHSSQ
ncbi:MULTISPECIES: AbrB family transcriptional regulator [Gracilibacillus]|uniref:AbrB family transcriptional regulator n=1 Tax=Gracilibacillus TaxID=74385 RepID=UPI00082581A6|nr:MULTISPECIES: AbrB family transcriptional regulator [Gracilibacillus]